MYFDEIRRALEAAPRCTLSQVTALLWRAFAEGQITEAQAETLSGMIETRRALPPATPIKRPGSRPRSSASIERRRRWAASGVLPPQLAAQFTLAEQAVLSVVASEVVKQGRCALHIGHIAALSGVGETTVRTALRQAKQLGLVAVEIRRITAWRNDSNLVTVVSAEWSAWLARGGRRGGFKFVEGTILRSKSEGEEKVEAKQKGYRGRRGGKGQSQARHRPSWPQKAAQAV